MRHQPLLQSFYTEALSLCKKCEPRGKAGQDGASPGSKLSRFCTVAREVSSLALPDALHDVPSSPAG